MIPARDVVPGALGELLRRQPSSAAKVRFAWEATVGPAIARVTTVTLDADGILHVATDTEPWRREIERSAAVIRARLRSLLAPDPITRISVRTRKATP